MRWHSAVFAVFTITFLVAVSGAAPTTATCVCKDSKADWRLVGGWYITCPTGKACEPSEGTCSQVNIDDETKCQCTTETGVNKDNECSCSVVLSGAPPNAQPECENLGACTSPQVCNDDETMTTYTCTCGDL